MGKRHRKRNKTQNKIHKAMDKMKQHKQQQNKLCKLKQVFDTLRNHSQNCFNNSQSDSVIILDNTIPDVNNKRKLSDSNIFEPNNKLMKVTDNEAVVIPDDDNTLTDNNCIMTPRKNLNTAPIDCSTPIAKLSNNNNVNSIINFNSDVINLTKEINRSSYLTIDLTTDTCVNKTSASNSQLNTVIDLDKTDDPDCTVVSCSNTSLSMSGDSEVTVLQNKNRKKNKQMNRFVNGIAKLNASEKGHLLELITEKIFSGCQLPKKIASNIAVIKERVSQATETVEDTYIKEVILGVKQSRNSIGSNIYNPRQDRNHTTGLRMIIIDGSNVAMQHGKGRVFSVRGLKICIDYFVNRGHVVKAFVPRFRCKWGKSTEPKLLDDLERQGLVVYTPSREIQGRMVTSYDDRYIVQCAAEFDGVIVSGDNYRDLLRENERWRFVIENRLLMFTWVNDMIMFPRDPLGRNGPSLENFLRHTPASK
ncbi:hypothetical protein ACJJTC_004197 [Scirpophaga incertulas]